MYKRQDKMKKNLFRAIIAFILAGISMALGIIMIPKVTDVGNTILLIVIGVILLIYVYYCLLYTSIIEV